MASIKILRYGNPDFLRKIRPENLRAFLLKFKDFFNRIKFAIPDGDFSDADLDRLAGILVSPPSFTPGLLLNAVEMLEMLTSTNGWSELQMLAPDLVRKLKSRNDGAGDIAIKVWLLDRHAIERIYTKFSISSARKLVCFRANPGTTITTPTKSVCEAIASDLALPFDDFFDSKSSEVMVFEEGDGYAFLIRHGDVVRRIGVLDDDNNPETKAIRPLKHDVGFLLPTSWEFQLAGRSDDIRELYRSVFSKHLFGAPGALQPAKRFTLDPLRVGRLCLNVADMNMIEGAWLRELRLRRKLSTGGTIHFGDDVFREIETMGAGYLSEFDLIHARFFLRVKGRRKGITLTLNPDEDSLRGDTHDPLGIEWLESCRFTIHANNESVLEAA